MLNTPLKRFVTGFNRKTIQIHPIFLTDADNDYILYEIELWEKIEVERNVSGNSDDM